ncbi:phage portal protein [Clostridium neonatale]|uniref:phage portal protein n=1 Tax=Clostridium neonatale TaxID=137838 RepID=UPI00291BD4E8|nr:Phage portal protein, lambda family [Clostridium neonatale]CAI3561903.1 Phage portal protein, lambda family [Clostridium neonatale]CAI3582804.1 Phage portal protein, lambda family [Clostridium neonatale]CAI3675486.1 Phage portal protein, lambda family [Clostridium neonatale]
MDFIEKAIGAILPQVAFKREVARKKLKMINNSGYSNHGASYSKKSLQGWIHRGGAPEEDIDNNIKTLRERSRDLYMGTPIATGALKTLRTNVVGSGLKLKSNIDYEFLKLSEDEADKLEATIEREFSSWAESVSCDMARLNDFYELQQLVFLSHLMCGDAFVLLPFKKRIGMIYDLRIQLIEADRVCTPPDKVNDIKISGGVECDEHGEIIAYYISKFHPLSSRANYPNEWDRIQAFGEKTGRRNILHLMESERIGQRRGVSILAPVIESLKQLSRYTEAELMAAVVSGMFTVFIESPAQTNEDPILSSAIPYDDEIDSDNEDSYELGNGNIVELSEGEKANTASPGRPNVAFDGFVNAICRQIGSALEIPHDLLLKQFNASYSASRAALLEAWKMFKMRRQWLANDFCQPIYEEWMCEAVARGRIYAPGFFDSPIIRRAYCKADWNGPTQGQLDPVKEANAAVIRVLNGFSTRAKETVELTGGNFNENHRQRVKEEKMRQEIPQGTESKIIKEKDEANKNEED